MRRGATVLLVCLVARVASAAPASIEICAQDAATSLSIANATVILVASSGGVASLVTGSNGCVAAVLAEGSYRVTVAAPGTVPKDLRITTPLDPPRVIAMLEVAHAQKTTEITIEASRERAEETRHSITPEEARTLPGSNGDAIKVIQNLPGMARAAFGSGALLVRGAAPGDTRVFLDAQEIPQLYHFGGLTSVVNTEILSSIDFLPGGFGVRYGGATAGVVDLTTKGGRDDRLAGVADANVYDAQAVAQGPIGSHGRVIGAIRRSYIDAVLNAVIPADALAFSVAPRYYDYQLRYDAPTAGSGANWRVLVYGSDDALGFLARPPNGTSGAARGSFRFETKFHRLQTPWTQPLGSGWIVTLTPSIGYQDIGVDAGETISIENIRNDGSLRAEASGPLAPGINGLFGLESHIEDDRIGVDIRGTFGGGGSRVIQEHADFVTGRTGLYGQATWSASDEILVIPGLRLDAFTPAHEFSADPRLAVRWTPSEILSWKAYAGMYHQPPTAQQWDRQLGNPSLRSPWAFQTGFGGRRVFAERTKIESEVFYKWLGDQVVSRPANSALGESRSSFTNHQVGRAYGLEILAKREMGKGLYGWIAYTLSKSERADPYTQGGWRAFQYDQTHILTVLAGWKLGHGWEAGARVRYTTGNPTTLVSDAIFNGNSGNYVPISGPINGARIPAFTQLDVRVDRRFRLFRADWDVYLDVQNATNRKNVEAERYDFDYTTQVPVTGLPTIPSLGLRAEFP